MLIQHWVLLIEKIDAAKSEILPGRLIAAEPAEPALMQLAGLFRQGQSGPVQGSTHHRPAATSFHCRKSMSVIHWFRDLHGRSQPNLRLT